MAWRRRGAIHAALALPADTPDPELGDPQQIGAFLRETAGQVRRGELTPAQGVTLTGVANAALRCWEVSLAKRLAELEAVLSERAKPAGMFVIEEGEA